MGETRSRSETPENSKIGGKRNLPSILINDGPLSLQTLDDGVGTATFNSLTAKAQGLPLLYKSEMEDTTEHDTARSFTSIITEIPTGELADTFSNNSMQFSKRGSILLGSKNPDILPRASEPERDRWSNKSIKSVSSLATLPELQYIVCAQKLSSEERRMSKKVRSLYEHRMDEDVLQTCDRPSPTVPERLETAEAIDSGHLLSHSTLYEDSSSVLPRPNYPSINGSFNRMRNEYNEAAGGIEDWTDVDAHDVDRYGFIRAGPHGSKRSSLVSLPAQGMSRLQHASRPTTSLEAVDENSRHTPARSAFRRHRFSIAPESLSRGTHHAALSIRSKKSTSSTTYKTFSRRTLHGNVKWLVDASNMLSSPIELCANEFEESPTMLEARKALELKRSKKWERMAVPTKASAPRGERHVTSLGAGRTYHFDISSPKVISRTWKGIPDRWRAVAWHSFLTSSAARISPTSKPVPSDSDLVSRFFHLQTLDCSDDSQIDMDVPRTIGGHVMFRKRYRGGQRLLFRLLRALALQFPNTGYVQGMAPLAATLLCYFEEERAFICACRMWTLRGIGWLYGGKDGAMMAPSVVANPVREAQGGSALGLGNGDEANKNCHAGTFEGLVTALQDLERGWMAGTAVGDFLISLPVSPTSFGTKWYLTLFSYSMPFAAVLRVWDVFILLGEPTSRAAAGQPDLDILHATSSALLAALSETLIDADFENAMKTLTGKLDISREDVLMNTARGIWEQHRKRSHANR